MAKELVRTKRRGLLLGSLLAASVFMAGWCKPAVIGSQAVRLHPQETSMWCWATSGEMIMDFMGHDVSQCDQANKRFGSTDCCNNPVPSTCINGVWPEFDKYNFEFKTTFGTPLSWYQVKNQIYCKKKPFAFSWHWSGCGGRRMVVISYVTIDGTDYVTINDPWPPNIGDQRVITYTAYVSGSGYSHWSDYYDITYK